MIRLDSQLDNGQREKSPWRQFKVGLLETISNLLGLLNGVKAGAGTDKAEITGQMAPIVTDASSYTYLLSPEEEARHKNQLLEQAKNDQSFSARQVSEQADFTQQLSGKNLAELMSLLREEHDQAAKSGSKLAHLDAGQINFATSDPGAQWEYYQKTMSTQDCDKIVDASRIAHIPTDVPAVYTTSFSSVRDDEDPAKRLEATKKWLRDTFSKPTDAVLLTMRDGEHVVVSLGVSDDEIAMAKSLQRDQEHAKSRAAEITDRVRERVGEQFEITPAFRTGNQMSPMATLTPGASPASHRRDV